MPPKRGRGSIRGRGGRGRGGGDSVDTPAPAPPHEESPAADVESSESHTPQRTQDDMDVDSPPTQPTETPAPTPVRLAPIRPPPSIASGTAGTATKAPSRFVPKAKRRDERGRQELEDAERLRQKGITAEAARAAQRSNALRARGGRGDAMGRGRTMTTGPASGAFAALPASEKGKPQPRHHYGTGGASSSKGRGGSRGGTSGTRVKTEGITVIAGDGTPRNFERSKDDPPYREPEYPDDDDTPRIDIEKIHELESSDDEPIVTGVRRIGMPSHQSDSHKGSIRPVRVARRLHKDRVSEINDDETLIKADPDANKHDPDAVMVDETRSAPAPAPTDALNTSGVQVKLEPVDEGARDTSPPLPEFKRPTLELEQDAPTQAEVDKALINDEAAPLAAPTHTPGAAPSHARKPKPRQSSTKDKKLILQTVEDREEHERHIQDLEFVRNELVGLQYAPIAPARDSAGDIDMDSPVPSFPNIPKDGRLYLFQFPPILPQLYDPLTQEKPVSKALETVEIKNEFEAEVERSMQGTADTSEKGKGKEKDKDTEMGDEGEIILEPEDPSTPQRREREKYVDREGFIGKLIVRESGRVELDWGGTKMLMGRGIETGFLTTGVLVDPMEEKRKEADEAWKRGGEGLFAGNRGVQPVHEGRATGMGSVLGKFVVTPDWEAMMESER